MACIGKVGKEARRPLLERWGMNKYLYWKGWKSYDLYRKGEEKPLTVLERWVKAMTSAGKVRKEPRPLLERWGMNQGLCWKCGERTMVSTGKVGKNQGLCWKGEVRTMVSAGKLG